jgi:hypothetical protein
VTGRHAGQYGGRPAYLYTGRHEAPTAASCTAFKHVHGGDGEAGGLLVCNRSAHDDPQHWDGADDVLWQYAPAPIEPVQATPAGAVA